MDLTKLRLMNAAGWCKLPETVGKLAKTSVTEITVGSITVAERTGNEGDVFWPSPDGVYALNSLGLPNPGLEKYQELLPLMRDIARAAGKSLRVNIAGFAPDEYATLTRVAAKYADTIEINLGCPNVWGKEGQKPIASFDIPLMKEIIKQVLEVTETELHDVYLAVKLSPYSDPGFFGSVIAVLKDFESFVDEVVTSNTFPNAYAYNNKKPAITPAEGFSAMSGNAMRAISLGQSMRARRELGERFEITRVGGISSGADLMDTVRGGIISAQIGTHYFVHDEKVFGELHAECVELI